MAGGATTKGRRLKVAVAGVGFIGQVHVRSARIAGAEVVGVSGGNPDRTRATAERIGVERVFGSSEELVTSNDVDVVHICTPNNSHAELARLAIEAGKHVICEKPLATSAADARALVASAEQTGVVAAVPFVYRFHPVVREIAARVARGDAGSLRLLHGSYQQDWLSRPDDWSWRIDPALGGASRAFADIGSHWCDLVEFASGHRITHLIAETITAIAERTRGEQAAFAAASGEGERVDVHGDDAVTVMFKTDKGAHGSLVVSQVSPGRKNRLWFEFDGAERSYVFDQEENERLWSGSRESNTVEFRDPAFDPASARYSFLPSGHAQGYADCFDLFVKDVYAAIGGDAPAGLPVFADGARAAALTEAVMASATDKTWKEVG